MRLLPSLLVCFVLSLAVPRSASAEWYLAAYLGGNHTIDSTVSIRVPTENLSVDFTTSTSPPSRTTRGATTDGGSAGVWKPQASRPRVRAHSYEGAGRHDPELRRHRRGRKHAAAERRAADEQHRFRVPDDARPESPIRQSRHAPADRRIGQDRAHTARRHRPDDPALGVDRARQGQHDNDYAGFGAQSGRGSSKGRSRRKGYRLDASPTRTTLWQGWRWGLTK